MKIRPFRKEDIGKVDSLWNTSLREDKASSQWYLEDNLLDEEKFEKIVANSNFNPNGAFVVSDGQQMVGFGWGAVKKSKSYEDEELETLSLMLAAELVALRLGW